MKRVERDGRSMGTFLIAIFALGGAIALVGTMADSLKFRRGEGIQHLGQFIMMGAAVLWILATIVMTLDSAHIVTP